MYSYTLSLTSVLGRGGCLTPCPGRYIPGKDPVPVMLRAGWDPGSVWTDAKNLNPPPVGFDPRTVQPVPTTLSRPTLETWSTCNVLHKQFWKLRYLKLILNELNYPLQCTHGICRERVIVAVTVLH